MISVLYDDWETSIEERFELGSLRELRLEFVPMSELRFEPSLPVLAYACRVSEMLRLLFGVAYRVESVDVLAENFSYRPWTSLTGVTLPCMFSSPWGSTRACRSTYRSSRVRFSVEVDTSVSDPDRLPLMPQFLELPDEVCVVWHCC